MTKTIITAENLKSASTTVKIAALIRRIVSLSDEIKTTGPSLKGTDKIRCLGRTLSKCRAALFSILPNEGVRMEEDGRAYIAEFKDSASYPVMSVRAELI